MKLCRWRHNSGTRRDNPEFMRLHAAVIVTLIGTSSGLPAQQPPSLWHHNGSTLHLVASGQKREFYYEEPRAGMVQAGARKGSLLFSGVAKANRYIGTAFIYHPQCGTFSYQVSGPILDNYRRVILRGQASRIGRDCKVIGHFSDTLEFVLLGAASDEANILKAFVGTWTDSPGVCKSKLDEDSSAAVFTIEGTEITWWFTYAWEGEKDQVYGSCGVTRGHVLPDGTTVVVDLDCDHPGHSQKGVSLRKIDENRIVYGSRGVLHRCR
jgi:hypothetical protein